MENNIPIEIREEIERKAKDFSDVFMLTNIADKAVHIAVKESYLICARYWVSRMITERTRMEQTLNELRVAAGEFAVIQKIGGQMKGPRDRLVTAMWEADKVTTFGQKIADQNERAKRKKK